MPFFGGLLAMKSSRFLVLGGLLSVISLMILALTCIHKKMFLCHSMRVLNILFTRRHPLKYPLLFTFQNQNQNDCTLKKQPLWHVWGNRAHGRLSVEAAKNKRVSYF